MTDYPSDTRDTQEVFNGDTQEEFNGDTPEIFNGNTPELTSGDTQEVVTEDPVICDMEEQMKGIDKKNDQEPLINYSILCFARAILYLILTGCSFIPIELNEGISLTIFIVSLMVITAISYFVLYKKERKDSEISKAEEWSFFILFFLCLFSFPHFCIFSEYEERHYFLLYPCGVDILYAILYRYIYITNHHIVLLIIVIVTWLTYVGLNLGLHEWGYFAIIFGFFTLTLGTRAFTIYWIFKCGDDRLGSPLFGVSVFLCCHIVPTSAIFVGVVFAFYYIFIFLAWLMPFFVKCLGGCYNYLGKLGEKCWE